MIINIILPLSGHEPMGALKVMYEFANGLQIKGHEVRCIHSKPYIKNVTNSKDKAIGYLIYLARALGVKGGYKPTKWFKLNPKVKILWLPSLHHCLIPNADISFSNTWFVNEWVKDWPKSKGVKWAYVTDYEHYFMADDSIKKRIVESFSKPMHSAIVSPICGEMMRKYGSEPNEWVPNGLDFNTFKLINPIDSPLRTKIGFSTRSQPQKRTEDAIDALKIVQEKTGEKLDVWSFGPKKPAFMPDWIDFYEYPDDAKICELYNLSKIFVVASTCEGWGLPGSEAMTCGAALVSTDNGGIHGYAKDAENALIAPILNPPALSDCVIKLLQDDTLRLKLAFAGNKNIQKFTWNYAVDLIEDLFCKSISKG